MSDYPHLPSAYKDVPTETSAFLSPQQTDIEKLISERQSHLGSILKLRLEADTLKAENERLKAEYESFKSLAEQWKKDANAFNEQAFVLRQEIATIETGIRKEFTHGEMSGDILQDFGTFIDHHGRLEKENQRLRDTISQGIEEMKALTHSHQSSAKIGAETIRQQSLKISADETSLAALRNLANEYAKTIDRLEKEAVEKEKEIKCLNEANKEALVFAGFCSEKAKREIARSELQRDELKVALDFANLAADNRLKEIARLEKSNAELLEACKEFLSYLKGESPCGDDCYEMATKAIASAKEGT